MTPADASTAATEPISIRVPASSANLGPGFDTLGLALALYDEVSVAVRGDGGVHIDVVGEGADEVDRGEENLVLRALRRAFSTMGEECPGVSLRCHNAIPHGKGLGSSAAAIVSGLFLARALVKNHEYSDADLLADATAMEGHPDNVAAALHGGLTVAWTNEQGIPSAVKLTTHPSVRIVMAMPTFAVATKSAREALPETLSYADAIHNLARSSLLVHALTHDPSLLWEGTSDRMHQRVRSAVYPASVSLVDRLRDSGLAAAVSGAGPAVIVLTPDPNACQSVSDLCSQEDGWSVREMAISAHGVAVQAG